MTTDAPITEADVDRARAQLSDLAKKEYGVTLEGLFAADEPVIGNQYDPHVMRTLDSSDAFWRVGRLAGITVKEPFAKKPGPIGNRVTQTGALRYWDLNPEVAGAEHPEWWQYNLIVSFLAEEDHRGELDWLPSRNLPTAQQVKQFLEDAHSERGTSRPMIVAVRRRICTDRQSQEDEPESKGRFNAEPLQLVTGGSITVAATQLQSAVPWLANDGSRLVVVSIAMLIVRYGLDGFCRRTAPSPVTGIAET